MRRPARGRIPVQHVLGHPRPWPSSRVRGLHLRPIPVRRVVSGRVSARLRGRPHRQGRRVPPRRLRPRVAVHQQGIRGEPRRRVAHRLDPHPDRGAGVPRPCRVRARAIVGSGGRRDHRDSADTREPRVRGADRLHVPRGRHVVRRDEAARDVTARDIHGPVRGDRRVRVPHCDHARVPRASSRPGVVRGSVVAHGRRSWKRR